ncbi:Cytochrome c oxidase subunit 2, partial [Trachymyrmex cornetzi]
IVIFHDSTIIILTFITIFIFFIIISSISNKLINRFLLERHLNQTLILINRPGIFFGQCSEICGINHRFIPIAIESTNLLNFKK